MVGPDPGVDHRDGGSAAGQATVSDDVAGVDAGQLPTAGLFRPACELRGRGRGRLGPGARVGQHLVRGRDLRVVGQVDEDVLAVRAEQGPGARARDPSRTGCGEPHHGVRSVERCGHLDVQACGAGGVGQGRGGGRDRRAGQQSGSSNGDGCSKAGRDEHGVASDATDLMRRLCPTDVTWRRRTATHGRPCEPAGTGDSTTWRPSNSSWKAARSPCAAGSTPDSGRDSRAV